MGIDDYTYLKFNPLIEDYGDYVRMMNLLQEVYPRLRWREGQKLSDYPKKWDFVGIEFLNIQDMRYVTTSYRDHAKYIDGWKWYNQQVNLPNADDIFTKLHEGEEKYTPKVGDVLYRKENSRTGNGFRENVGYPITRIKRGAGAHGEDLITVYDDSGFRTNWTIQVDENGLNYEDFFFLIPKDIQDTDFFGKLYENDNNKIDYSFLLNGDLVGLQFYEPKEFEEAGTIYTIEHSRDIRSDEIRVTWVNTKRINWSGQVATIKIKDFIADLNSGYLVILPKEEVNTDFLYESEDNNFDWVKDITPPNNIDENLYVVTNTGMYYPHNPALWVYFDIPNFKKCINGVDRHHDPKANDKCIDDLYRNGTLATPKRGDICYRDLKTWDKESYFSGTKDLPIHHMIRVEDGAHFVICNPGIQPYKD